MTNRLGTYTPSLLFIRTRWSLDWIWTVHISSHFPLISVWQWPMSSLFSKCLASSCLFSGNSVFLMGPIFVYVCMFDNPPKNLKVSLQLGASVLKPILPSRLCQFLPCAWLACLWCLCNCIMVHFLLHYALDLWPCCDYFLWSRSPEAHFQLTLFCLHQVGL